MTDKSNPTGSNNESSINDSSNSENHNQILNLNQFDAFEDVEQQGNQPTHQIHLRLQQRNARKCTTTIEGIDPSLDYKKMIRYFKKKFSCNGSITTSDEYGKIIQLTGDQRENVKIFLIENEITTIDRIVLHGF